MARARFDRDEVIEKVIDMFWLNGFNGTSMQQIVDETGLKPGSIYYSFGNKEALFKLALDHYAQKRINKIRLIIDSAASVGEGICTYLAGVAQEAANKHFRSCFLLKTQLELAAAGNELHKFAASKLEGIESILREYLEREFDSDLSRIRAASVMLHMYGMRVYGYHKGSVELMLLSLRDDLAWLPW